MPCEKYQAALIDLAARGAEPFGEVRAHLAACASCRSYIEQEQFLLAAVDSGVRSSVNAGLPVALVQRLEARLAQQAAARRRAFSVRTLAGAGAVALVAALLLILRPVDLFRTHGKPEAMVATATRGPALPARPATLAPTSRPTAFASMPSGAGHRNTSRGTSKVAARNEREPEVLVPSDERESLARFVRGLRGQPELAEALLARIPDRTQSSFPLPLIQIARLEILPLEPPTDETAPHRKNDFVSTKKGLSCEYREGQ
jgi:hypothetical protein